MTASLRLERLAHGARHTRQADEKLGRPCLDRKLQLARHAVVVRRSDPPMYGLDAPIEV